MGPGNQRYKEERHQAEKEVDQRKAAFFQRENVLRDIHLSLIHILMASNHVGGLSGAFIPVSEDDGMINAANCGSLTLEKLEAMTAVCSVGIDMVVIPGDTTAEVISGLIADEAAIGMVNSKTTAVRVIPAIGHKAGDVLDFGGLLGHAPIMPISKFSPAVMIHRGGRIPAPMQALKN